MHRDAINYNVLLVMLFPRLYNSSMNKNQRKFQYNSFVFSPLDIYINSQIPLRNKILFLERN
jgi:hypothetical protein